MSGRAPAGMVDGCGGPPGPGRVASVDPEETTRWEQVAPRRIDESDWRRSRQSVAEILAATDHPEDRREFLTEVRAHGAWT